jgi:hypothetical protein
LITLKRDKTLEIKKLIKVAAEKANQIISRRDDHNSSAALLLGNLLTERGKLNESKTIFEQIMNHQKVGIYNGAFAEFLMKKYGKALTILQSPQSKREWKRKTFFAVVLMLNKRFKDGEKKMKYRLLRTPSRKNYFNLGSIIHEKVKRKFSKRSADLGEMKKLVRQLDWVQKVFSNMFKSISNASLISVESNYDHGEIERAKLKNLKNMLKDQLFYIEENRGNYGEVIREEGQKVEKQKNSVRERKRLVEEKEEKERLRLQEAKQKKELEKQQRQQKALKFQNEMLEKQEDFSEIFEKKRKAKAKKSSGIEGDISMNEAEFAEFKKRKKKVPVVRTFQ